MNANMRHAILERSWKCYVKRVIRNVEYAFQTICYNARRLACITVTCTGDSSSNLDLYIYTITKQKKNGECYEQLVLDCKHTLLQAGKWKEHTFAWCIQCFHQNQAPPISKQFYDIVKPHLHVSHVFIQNEQYQGS